MDEAHSEGYSEAAPQRAAPAWRTEAACVALVIGVLGYLTWAVSRTRESPACQSQLKRVGLGMFQYMRDYDEKMPLKEQWPKILNPYVKSMALFDCPNPTASYAMHKRLGGIKMLQVKEPAVLPLVFDSNLNRLGAWDNGQSWPATGLHRSTLHGPPGANTLFFDGHVKWTERRPPFKVGLAK